MNKFWRCGMDSSDSG